MKAAEAARELRRYRRSRKYRPRGDFPAEELGRLGDLVAQARAGEPSSCCAVRVACGIQRGGRRGEGG